MKALHGGSRLLLPGLALLLLGGCDADPVLFPQAAEVEYLTGGPGGAPAPALRGVAGEVLTPAPAIRLLDASGNPVPGAPVRIEVLQGDGTVAQADRVSGRDGRIGLTGWRMGQVAGMNRIRVEVTGRPGSAAPGGAPSGGGAGGALTLEIEALGEPGPPARIVGTLEGEDEGRVGTPLDAALQVRLTDRYENPVPDHPVRFQVLAGGGTVASPGVVTGADGRASPGSWTLGPAAGAQLLQASAEGVTGVSATFSAQGLPGPPAALQVEGSAPLTAPVGETLTLEGLAARVTDALGNPLEGVAVVYAPAVGSGSVSHDERLTGVDGRAPFPAWTLGPGPGVQRLALTVDGEGQPLQRSVQVEAWAEAEEPDPEPDPDTGVRVTALHLNQGSQTLSGEIPLVTGRPGLLRVFLEADEPSPPGVRVRIRVRQGAALVVDQVVGRGGGGGIGTSPGNPDDQGASWNLALPGSVVQAGMSLRIDVDPDGVLGVPPGTVPGFPEDGGWHHPALVSVPTFRVTFLPVLIQETGLLGRITPANVMDYAGTTVDAFPVGAFDFQVRTLPLVYDGAWASDPSAAWSRILQDVRDLRLAEGALDRYYHGILRRPPGSGIAGLAYVVTNPGSIISLAAVSFDELPTAGPVVAHEFGHNFGRWHTPCGVSGQVDLGYPHPGATLGSPGYSAADGTLRGLGAYRDVMSYCFPLWPGDYTYAAVLGMRLDRPVGTPVPVSEALQGVTAAASTPWAAAAGARRASEAGLLLGGGWSEGEGVWLRPGISVHAPATRPDPAGDVEVTLLDAAGRTLASGRFHSAPPDHVEAPTERHFGVVLPVTEGVQARVASVRVTTPSGAAQERVSPAAAGGELPRVRITAASLARAEGASRGALRLEWDAEAWPVLVVRDAPSGEILGFLRSGDARVPVPGGAGAPGAPGAVIAPDQLRGLGLALELSNGVRSRPVTLE